MKLGSLKLSKPNSIDTAPPCETPASDSTAGRGRDCSRYHPTHRRRGGWRSTRAWATETAGGFREDGQREDGRASGRSAMGEPRVGVHRTPFHTTIFRASRSTVRVRSGKRGHTPSTRLPGMCSEQRALVEHGAWCTRMGLGAVDVVVGRSPARAAAMGCWWVRRCPIGDRGHVNPIARRGEHRATCAQSIRALYGHSEQRLSATVPRQSPRVRCPLDPRHGHTPRRSPYSARTT